MYLKKIKSTYPFSFQYTWLLFLQEEDTILKSSSIHLGYLKLQSIIPAIKLPAGRVAEIRSRLSL